MNTILCIESSAQQGSVAVFRENKLVSSWETNEERSHSRLLASEIDKLIRGSVTYNELNAVAISAGPGSYTGLRIGTSIAKGISFAMDIPLLAISTLDIIASKVGSMPDHWLCPIIHARKNEVYCALINHAGDKVLEDAARVLNPGIFDEYRNEQIIFCGNGADLAMEILGSDHYQFHPEILPHAKNMGALAIEKWKSGDLEDLDNFEPEYLKPVYTTTPRK